MANALAYTSVTSILMKVFPQHATMVASYTEMFHGLGYLIGKVMSNISWDNQILEFQDCVTFREQS